MKIYLLMNVVYGIECELNVLELHISSGCWPHSESCISITCLSRLWNMMHTYPFLLKRDAHEKALRVSELEHGGHRVCESYTLLPSRGVARTRDPLGLDEHAEEEVNIRTR